MSCRLAMALVLRVSGTDMDMYGMLGSELTSAERLRCAPAGRPPPPPPTPSSTDNKLHLPAECFWTAVGVVVFFSVPLPRFPLAIVASE